MILLFTGASIVPCIMGDSTQPSITPDKKEWEKKELTQTFLSNPPNEEWNKTFGGENDDAAYDVEQTKDGGFIIGGYTKSYGIAIRNPWLIKTDFKGNEEWNRTYNYCSLPYLSGNIQSVQQTNDGGYILGCSFYNATLPKSKELSPFDHNKQGFVFSTVLIKTDSNGNETWRKTPFINDYSFFCYSGKQTSDGGYIATGNGLIKTDTAGNEQWNVTIPTSFTSGQQTTDGGYVIAGSTSSYYGGDVWLIKFGPEGTPNLQFTITGGLGAHVKITNNGTINASSVAWQINVQGGILGLMHKTVNGTVDIAIGESKTVGTGMLLGFGGIQITAIVDEETKTTDGTQFFIFTLVKK
jgi:hypothetical protein